MKKSFALLYVCLCLAVLVPISGCGGSSHHDPVPGATVVQQGQSRAVRITWAKPSLDGQASVFEYQVVRAAPGDNSAYNVVGVTDSETTTFLDTAADRPVTYTTSLVGTDGLGKTKITKNVSGLSSGTYSYSVVAYYYSGPENGIYGPMEVLQPTAPVSVP